MFGIDVLDAALLPSLLIAFTAGVISFLSPCVLPIVPPYLAYMAGANIDDIQQGQAPRLVPAALFFVLGLSTVFLFLGFTASALAQTILQYQNWLSMIGGGIVIIFGLHFLGVFRIPFLYREARFDAGDQGGSVIGAYLLGLAFAFGWTPCIGPILGSILILASEQGSVGRGTVMLAFYAIGLGLPFLLAAIFAQRSIGVMNRLKRHMGMIEKISGIMLIVVGAMLALGIFTAISNWLIRTFPAIALIG